MESLGELWRSLHLGDATRHTEALTLAATRALRAGRPADAYELIDRRCRIDARPRAADLAIRALAARLCGWQEEAEADLLRAGNADPLDPFVAATRLRLSLGEDANEAASALIDSPEASPDAKRAALERMAGQGRATVRLDLLDDRLTGLAAWPGTGAARLELFGPAASLAVTLAPDPSLPFVAPSFAAALVDLEPDFVPDRFRLVGPMGTAAEGRLLPRSARALGGKSRAPALVPTRASLGVVVPIYRDLETTRLCLEALLAETENRDIRVVAVEDASPEPELVAWLEERASKGRIELLRNPVNLGFAASVQRGITALSGCDILLLNADAILPTGALDRLQDALYSAPDIGTATPLSNNGEYASFPRHGEAAPAPDKGQTERIDEAARLANNGVTVDLPNGTGFCLTIRHDCMEAVGTMPLIYGRGYFEDVELCLRARRAGFRNVCAPSVYVVHHGGLSFGTEKRVLTVRNLALLRRRFPGFATECAAYAKADPLREAREAIAARLGKAGTELPSPPAAGLPPRSTRVPTLALVPGPPSPREDAFIRALSAALRSRDAQARIVVLGRTGDDLALMGRGNVFVTGPVAPGDGGRTALRYGARGLAAPFAAELGRAVALETGLPLAPNLAPCEDDGVFSVESPNAPHVRDPILAIVDWFADRLAATPARGDGPVGGDEQPAA
ncbi:glycosyltransferase family 2 protein [Aureimonas psammosilenae]|uniref:glycosyltransferase family 2 protein n=1 Tax=Aureimonas psammosilenae TaxID=2495496 RepID=UPI001260A605|nr:glycosyltransferase family 2 protein [Aureimonas psammosilenae]